MASKKTAHLTLTDSQIAALEEWLEDSDNATFKRGLDLHHKGAVRTLEWIPEQEFVIATVQGGQLYQSIVHLLEDRVCHTECSCPVGADCKHVVAVMQTLMDWGGTRKGGSPAPAASKSTTESKAKPMPPSSPLVELVEARLGQTMKKGARSFLDQASQWWVRGQNTVSIHALRQATGQYSHGAWGADVPIFPPELPPQNEWEFLSYLDAALRDQQMIMPAPIPDAIDKTLQGKLVGAWNRLRSIRKWREKLGTWGSAEADEAPVLRLRLHSLGAVVECRKPGSEVFEKAKNNYLTEFIRDSYRIDHDDDPVLDAGSRLVLDAATEPYGGSARAEIAQDSPRFARAVGQLLSVPALRDVHLVSEEGQPLTVHDQALQWRMVEPGTEDGDYQLQLVNAQGEPVRRPLLITPGAQRHYVTPQDVYPAGTWPFKSMPEELPIRIPAAALETREGLSALDSLRLPVPSRVGGSVRTVRPLIEVSCRTITPDWGKSSYLALDAQATYENVEAPSRWTGDEWVADRDGKRKQGGASGLVRIDRSPMPKAAAWLRLLPLKPQWEHGQNVLTTRMTKDFPAMFHGWLKAMPEGVTLALDSELASFQQDAVAGVARLDVQPADEGMDWFDLKVDLSVADITLTQEEIALLLKAKGGWVHLKGKGWKRLEFQFTDEQRQELADLGLADSDFSGETQRLHALQLAGKGRTLLPESSAATVSRRAEEIQTRVAPALPAAISATLRPYQLSGFHFLAYLSTNRFGGVLADDMGLGKTLQTLAWIAWLRESQGVTQPVLVVCPKSVQDNWRAEAARFCSALRVTVWSRDDAGETGLKGDADLLVIHYQQLRQHEDSLTAMTWGAVVLDEAQAIKNPTAQTTLIAGKLRATHRLALTGTPIENRLLDLWSILGFAMPGALGSRTHFTKHFDSKTDPFARRRLAARVRPFLLRRTKKEVATDLPDRIEEDLMIELEGVQQKLYNAELKRARAQLLKATTSKQLDKLRFNILTSLLRLRQICCHPRLVGNTDAKATSTKLLALMEVIEPLIDEGQKVLVFSQFTEMLDLIEGEIAGQEWPCFKLTGKTDDRGPLVRAFQEHEGAAVFLISLKAGGFGLNLTAASYVVLFDPWWNPAVEAQAIDRTHRIGQQQTVIAYRLLTKGSIEEKIRQLQKQKGALANDILGEESFAQALTLDDFQFLLGGNDEAGA